MHEFKRRFPPPPSDWSRPRLADIADRVTTRNVERNPNVLTISAEFGLISQSEFFSRRVASESVAGYFLLERGDFAYNKSYSRGYPLGAIRRLDRYPKGCVSPLYICFRPRADAVDSDFLLHYLDGGAIDAGLADVAKEGVRNHGLLNVGVADFFSLEVPLPPAAEQRVVARILDTLDTTIRQTEAIIEKLKQVKQGLLHDLLTRGIDANGELRPPQSQAPHLYKDSPLGWIPREWEAIHMAEAIRELCQGWSPDCPPERAAVGRWGVLKTTAIVWDGYADHENKALPATLPPRPDLEVAPEDILITRAGPKERVAVVAYVAQTRPRLMISDKMYRLRLREEEVPAYFALALSSQYAQAAVTRTISGMADSQTNISQPIIRMLQVMRPPTDEQRAISLRAAALADRLRTEQGQLTVLGNLKIGLMDDLLTGRVRVTPLLDPAHP